MFEPAAARFCILMEYKRSVTGTPFAWKYEESVTGSLLAWKYKKRVTGAFFAY